MMKLLQSKRTILTASLFLCGFAYGQVGVNTSTPKATLDIAAKTTDGSKPEGIIAPRLTGDQIKSADANYGTDQKGTLIYATAAVNGSTVKTVNITAEGYYYFDGSIWQRIINNNTQNVLSADNGLTVGYNTPGNIGLGGTLAKNTDINTNGNNISFSGSGNLGLGTFSPNGRITIQNDNQGDTKDDFNINTFSATNTPGIFMNSSKGTAASPANIDNNRLLLTLGSSGRVNGSNRNLSSIKYYYKGDGTTTLSNILFQTSNTDRMLIDENGNVGIGTTTPTDSSILDLNSSSTGFLMPRMTTTQMNNITSPAGGLQVYNTDEKCTFLYNGTNWRSLCARTFQQSSAGATQVARGSSVDLTQSITLAGTQNVTVQASFNPMTYTNGSNNYALGSYDILIDGTVVTNGMRYSTQNAGNNLYRYSAVATWTTTLAPGSHTIIFRVTSDVAANGATVDTNAEDRRMIVTVN